VPKRRHALDACLRVCAHPGCGHLAAALSTRVTACRALYQLIQSVIAWTARRHWLQAKT